MLRGEASTTYSRFPYDTKPNTISPWPEISRLYSGIPLIYMVRHPVDRAFSHYRHWLRSGNAGTFEEAIEKQPPIIDCSRYQAQIEHVLEHMGDVPMFIETFDRFHREQNSVVEEVCDFLGIDKAGTSSGPDLHVNEHNSDTVISEWASRIPLVRRSRKLFPAVARKYLKKAVLATPVRRHINASVNPDPMSDSMRARLLEEFAPDVDFIESRLGRDLQEWRS